LNWLDNSSESFVSKAFHHWQPGELKGNETPKRQHLRPAEATRHKPLYARWQAVA
jgi:hypothetical protein